MIPSECGQLLRACSFYDNRKVTEEAMIAWSRAIAPGVTVPDAVSAIAEHHAETNDWCGPSHVNQRVKAIRRERLQRAGTPPMPGDLTWQQEKEWRQLWCAKVKDGATREIAAEETSRAMRIHELPAVEQAEAVKAIEAFAGRTLKPKPWRRRVEYVDDTPAHTPDAAERAEESA